MQPKMAYLANLRFPSERAHAAQMAHMCQAFAQAGWSVTLCVNQRSSASIEAVGQQFGFAEPQFSLVRFGSRRIQLWWRGLFYLSEAWFALLFYWRQRPQQFAVIYARSEWLLAVLSYLLPAEQLVWESHEAKLQWAARRILRRGIKTVVISSGIYEAYRAAGISEEQLLIADDGIADVFLETPPTKAEARAALDLAPDAFIALYIGGLDAWKGTETFLAASTEDSAIEYVVIGGTPDQIAALAPQYPRVQFLGSRPYAELHQHQQAADVLVIPNTATNPLSRQYTSPLKLFAHLASGVPLVITDIPSLTSVVEAPDVTVVPPDDPAALAAGVQAVQADYAAKQQAATALRSRAHQYTWTNRAKRITTFITP